jgi:1,4-alpha-glucan branching enzyme
MVRLITMALGGDGYLNFMGNEFGHPEWIDFPRDSFTDPSTGKFIEGNGGSLEKCRRRWDLADADFLRYKPMNSWDRAIQHLDRAFGFVTAPHTYVSKKCESDKVVVVERGDLVMAFNFHPGKSYTDYRIGCYHPGQYKVVLSSDEEVFGGYCNVTAGSDTVFEAGEYAVDGRPSSLQVYMPSRTVTVFAKAEWVDSQAGYKEDGIGGLAVKDLGPYPEITAGMKALGM